MIDSAVPLTATILNSLKNKFLFKYKPSKYKVI